MYVLRLSRVRVACVSFVCVVCGCCVCVTEIRVVDELREVQPRSGTTRVGCRGFQCVAMCCSVLQWVTDVCSVLHWVAVSQWVTLCCFGVDELREVQRRSVTTHVCCSVLQCVAVCCSALQCIAVYYSGLHCVALV